MDQEQRIRELERQVEQLTKAKAVSTSRTSLPPQNPSKPPSTTSSLKVMLMFFLVIPGVLAIAYWGFHEPINGTITGRGPGLGDWSIPVVECSSGHAYVPPFLGAVIRGSSESGPRIEVHYSPKNTGIFVWGTHTGKNDDPLSFINKDCKLLDVDIRWGHSRVNNIRTVEGHINADCTLPSGDQFTSQITFSNCY